MQFTFYIGPQIDTNRNECGVLDPIYLQAEKRRCHIGIALMRLNPRSVKRCGGPLRLLSVATVLGYSRLGLRQRSKAMECRGCCLHLSAEILVLVLSLCFVSSTQTSEPTCSRQSECPPTDSFFVSAYAPKQESHPSLDYLRWLFWQCVWKLFQLWVLTDLLLHCLAEPDG